MHELPDAPYALQPHAGPYASWPEDSALLHRGQPTGQRVPGYVIEAQYAAGPGVLLITSHDCPFEESNSFTLLDDAHRPVARAQLMVPYGSFLLASHAPVDDLTLALHYRGDVHYQLRLRPPVRGPFGLRTRWALKLARVAAPPNPPDGTAVAD